MKEVEIKIHNNNKTIFSQKINLQGSQPTIIQAVSKVNYELVDLTNGFAPDHIVTERKGNNLHILFDGKKESEVILEGFYKTEQSSLIGLSELGNYHYYTPDTGDIGDYVTLLTTTNQVSGHALGSRELSSAWWIDVNALQPSNNTSQNTGYVVNNGNNLILVDNSFDNEVSELNSELKSPAQATELQLPNAGSNPSSVTSDSLEAASQKANINEEDSSGWTPWAIGLASVAGIGLALSSGSKEVGKSPKSDTDANNNSNNFTGNDEDNTLIGTANHEVFTGGKGSDTLTGGGGADIFNYTDLSISDFLDGSIDTITDFNNDDKIQLNSNILKDYTSASNVFDYISYDNNTGNLSININTTSNTSDIHFATIDSNLLLSAENFVII